jgi:hypothetical protein
MRYLVLLPALAMPLIAWLSNQHVFGPDNGTISNMYPTLLAAAGYAFSIWGLIFVLDIAYAIWQLNVERDPVPSSRLPAMIGFALTALWMPVFSQEMFWQALVIIWIAWIAVLWAALRLANAASSSAAYFWFGKLPLPLHAGWLSVAIFLNTAQVIVAYRLLDTSSMLGWSLPLLGLAALLLLVMNARLRGNLAYAGAAIWGLAGLAVKQFEDHLDGGHVMGAAALIVAAVLAIQTLLLRRQPRRTPPRKSTAGSRAASR